jgi:hypothetical protein
MQIAPRSAAVVACLVLALALALVSARATSEYNYGKREYVIIRDGLAPN